MNLNISQIRLDGGTQAREMLNPATVEEYQDAIRAMAGQPVEVVARLAALNLEIMAVRSLLEWAHPNFSSGTK